jgi:hypothetical protein
LINENTSLKSDSKSHLLNISNILGIGEEEKDSGDENEDETEEDEDVLFDEYDNIEKDKNDKRDKIENEKTEQKSYQRKKLTKLGLILLDVN